MTRVLCGAHSDSSTSAVSVKIETAGRWWPGTL